MNAFRLWEEIQWISYLSLIGRLKKKNNMSARSESAVEQHTKNTGGVQGIMGGSLDADRHSMQSKMSGIVYGRKQFKKRRVRRRVGRNPEVMLFCRNGHPVADQCSVTTSPSSSEVCCQSAKCRQC